MNRNRIKEVENLVHENVLSNLFDKNQDAVVITDQDLTIEYFNPAVDNVTISQILKKTGANLLLQLPELSGFSQQFNRLRKGEPSGFSFRKGNHLIDFSASPLRFSEREYLIFIIRDTSVAPEKERFESIFKPLVQQSPIATAIFDPQGKPIYINRAYGELFAIAGEHKEYIIKSYELLEDEQIIECGLLPFIERSLAGDTVEIPTVLYNPVKTSVLKNIATDVDRYVRGSIFPVKNDKQEVNEIVVMLTDVTFQKQAEQILTEAHLKFQMLNLNLPGAIYEYEKELGKRKGKFIYMSQGCQEIFGVEPELVIRDENVLNFLIHPEDRSSFSSSVFESEKKNNQWEWEGRIIVKGEIKWIEAKSSLRVQPDGRRISYGVLLDVTEKKKAEEQYRKTEERLRMALQSADICLWEWDEDSGKIYLNSHWSKKYGFSSEDETDLEDWKRMVHPQDLSLVEQKLQDLISGSADNFELEYRLLSKSGDWSWILDKGKVIERRANGKARKIAGTHLDINDRKNSEAIIKKNEQLFTQLFENAPVGIVLLDEMHRVVQMNKGFEDLFGYQRQEIIGNALNKIIVPQESLNEAHEINIMTSSGRVGKLEGMRKKRNGELVPVIIYGVPVLMNRKTIGIYGIYVDISDRKKAEKELQVRNDELDNFVYKVSHDLRAPLSSILGLVNLAHIENNADDPREYIHLIGQRVRQLDSFIGDVLSHSKNLKLQVSAGKIDFKGIIDSCIKELSYLPHADKIDHKIQISGGTLYSDPWRVNEIFRNLISNAIKYLDRSKENPFISIIISIDRKAARIKFADNGIGIDKNLLSRIFDMFFRATTSSEGSGIGLYIVKNAIEKLGGTISVISKPEKGTTFDIEIPNLKPPKQ